MCHDLGNGPPGQPVHGSAGLPPVDGIHPPPGGGHHPPANGGRTSTTAASGSVTVSGARLPTGLPSTRNEDLARTARKSQSAPAGAVRSREETLFETGPH